MIKKPEAFIFDMDGLLVDSEPLWTEAEKKVFQTVGLELTDDMISQTRGLRADEVINYWYERYPLEKISKPELLNDLINLIISLIKEKATLLPGAQEAIAMSREFDCKVSLASSSHISIIQAVIDKFNLDFFDSVHSAETEAKGKPDPAVYLTACRTLKVEPENSLAFEDSANGVKAAKSAGMYCVAVPSKAERYDERFKKADCILDSLKEINKEIVLNIFNKNICVE